MKERFLINRFISLFRDNIQRQGTRGIGNIVRSVANFTYNEIEYNVSHRLKSTNIYERDWDVLVILDCATIDMINEVESEYSFIKTVRTHTSPGSCSNEWMRRTFTSEYASEMANTLHITANTSSARHLSDGQFLNLIELWENGWDSEIGTIPASTVTDHAIYHYRQHEPERAIIHYMQPHLPFVRTQMDGDINTLEGIHDQVTLKQLHEYGYTRQELWEASVENLRYALDSVEALLSNMSANRVVITSDHGQAFGEEGIWSHPCHTYSDILVEVPWCVTSATDKGERQPDLDENTESESDDQMSVDEKLRALGYK